MIEGFVKKLIIQNVLKIQTNSGPEYISWIRFLFTTRRPAPALCDPDSTSSLYWRTQPGPGLVYCWHRNTTFTEFCIPIISQSIRSIACLVIKFFLKILRKKRDLEEQSRAQLTSLLLHTEQITRNWSSTTSQQLRLKNIDDIFFNQPDRSLFHECRNVNWNADFVRSQFVTAL